MSHQSGLRLHHPVRNSLVGLLTLTSTLMMSPGEGMAASVSPASQALAIANYAEGTADHGQPAHPVTAVELTNAVSALRSSSTTIQPTFNIGEVPGYASLAGFIDQTTYTQVCVQFSPRSNGTPRVIACPGKAIVLWQTLGVAIGASQRAVVAASKQLRAVSGADVMLGAAAYHLKLAHNLSFQSGHGGIAEFVSVVFLNNVKYTVHLCVQLPRAAFGIPVARTC